ADSVGNIPRAVHSLAIEVQGRRAGPHRDVESSGIVVRDGDDLDVPDQNGLGLEDLTIGLDGRLPCPHPAVARRDLVEPEPAGVRTVTDAHLSDVARVRCRAVYRVGDETHALRNDAGHRCSQLVTYRVEVVRCRPVPRPGEQVA